MRSGFESRRCNRDIGQRSNDERLACCPASGLGLYAANLESPTKFERIGDFVDVPRSFGEARMTRAASITSSASRYAEMHCEEANQPRTIGAIKRTTRRRSFASGSDRGQPPWTTSKREAFGRSPRTIVSVDRLMAHCAL